MKEKSEGQLQFERGKAELENRIEHEELTDPQELGLEFPKILKSAMPKMTDSERDAVQRTQLMAHGVGADILSGHGRPVPGNDHKHPN